MYEYCTDVACFIRGEVDPGRFPHREHVRMGFEILRRLATEAARRTFLLPDPVL